MSSKCIMWISECYLDGEVTRERNERGGHPMKKYTSTEQLPLALSANDIAQILGISTYNAYCLMRSEGSPMMRMGRRLLVQKKAFLEWIDIHFCVKIGNAPDISGRISILRI